MYTKLQVINHGLGKLSSSRISRIDPPTTALERFCAEGYEIWKRSEIAKRRWVFATLKDQVLTKTATLADAARPNVYQLPQDCLRPVRQSGTEWVQSRRTLLSAYDTLKIDYISNAPENEFDPLFVEALACRIAMECAEFVTQSNSKKKEAVDMYSAALQEAARGNAYTIGYDDNTQDDSVYDFLTIRY